MPKGIYFVKIRSNDFITIKKITAEQHNRL
ncbi:MAG: hypothetical protein KAT68_14025 [Bacteroidales bacterium]|nr:hypothetical protein [Bacteroidales bacterium]